MLAAGGTTLTGNPAGVGYVGWALVFTSGGKRSIIQASGTSAATSLWGGLMALADQHARHDLGFVNPAIYRVTRGSSYARAFHDITTGSNNRERAAGR